MNHKAAVELLADVEQRFDVNSLLWNGEPLWALIRLKIWGEWIESETGGEERAAQRRIARRGGLLFRLMGAYRTLMKRRVSFNELRARQPEVLFFSNPKHYRFKMGEHFYNYLLDPWVEFVARSRRAAKFEIRTELIQETSPRLLPSVFVDFSEDSSDVADSGNVEHFDELNALLRSLPEPISLDEQELVTRFVRLKRRAAFFETLLEAVRPRAVFLVNYYDERHLPLVYACRKRGVTVVDIQHGKQGKYHAMYNHWTRIPPGGYDLLPDYFWVWGEESCANILQGRAAGETNHLPVVGGNLWVQKWKQPDWYVPDEEEKRFAETLRGKERVILFSVQPIAQPIPDCALDAMKASPATWVWLVRLHPKQKAEQAQIEKTLKDAGVTNFEMEYATRLPLYALMKQCHYHITGWSTVCYEALVFGLPTSIVHENGKSLYQDYIERGIFFYAENGGELLDQIRRCDTRGLHDEPLPYIVADEQVAAQALQTILSVKGATVN